MSISGAEMFAAFLAGERDVKVVLPCDECGKDSEAYAENEDGTFACKACVDRDQNS